MQSPFPGIDPYLEDPALWADFHRRLLETLRLLLSPALGDRYRVVVGQRRYAVGPEEHQEDYLEIRQSGDDSVVTLVDAVSPANKMTDTGREAYLETRREAREGGSNLVEIDLVRQGEPTLTYSREGLPDWDYAVTVTRQTQPERYEIYTATLQQRLPRFRLPLLADDRDTVLDLQTAFTHCFAEGGFFRKIDYRGEPPVPLDEEDRRGLEQTLRARGLLSHEEIALAAYYLWEQEGRPHGRDQEHWHQAVTELGGGKKA